MTTASEPKSYAAAWRDYRRRVWIFYGMWLAWIPLGLLVVSVITKLKVSPSVAPFILIPYMFAWVVAGNWQALFRCPRCEERFFVRRTGFFVTFRNIWARKCLNCGLPKYALVDPGPEQALEFEKEQPAFGRVFDLLAIPLAVITALLGFLSFMVGLFGKQPTVHELVAISVANGGVFAVDLLVALSAVASIHRKHLNRLLKEGVPLWLKLACPALFFLSLVFSLVRVVQGHTGQSPWQLLLGSATALSALYTAHVIRKVALTRTCPDGHAVPLGVSSCPVCGHEVSQL